VAWLRLLADAEPGPDSELATGRAVPLRIGPEQRRARLLIEEAVRVSPATGELSGARVELVVSASHEDAQPGHLLLLGGGPERRDRDRAAQISVVRLRPGEARLPAGDET